MKAFREILIRIKDLSDSDIRELFKSFCDTSNFYEFLVKESEDYSNNINGRGYIIYSLRTTDTEPAGIAIAKKTQVSLYVSNIVPKEKSKLNMSEYNAIAFKFVNDFKSFLRQLKSLVEIKISNEIIGIDKIKGASLLDKLICRLNLERVLGRLSNQYFKARPIRPTTLPKYCFLGIKSFSYLFKYI